MLDRIFDRHVMTPMQAIVAEHLPFITQTPDEGRIERAKSALDKVYAVARCATCWSALGGGRGIHARGLRRRAVTILRRLGGRDRSPTNSRALKAYRSRALARPSVARVVDEARPYRQLFPLGAPDRD